MSTAYKNSMEDVLKEIIRARGISALEDGKILASMFRDLSDQKKDQRIIQYFTECGGHTALLEARNLSPAMQKARFNQVVSKMCAETLVSEETAQQICNAFWSAVYGSSLMLQNASEKLQNQQYIQNDPLSQNQATYSKAKELYDIAETYANKRTNGLPTLDNYILAHQYYEQSAQLGYAEAQFIMGGIFCHGFGINGRFTAQKDMTQAVRWYRLAAEQGHKMAQRELGDRYYRGEGVAKNYPEAVYWYRKAAEQEDELAEYRLADCLQYGVGVEQNHIEAFRLFSKLAQSERGPCKGFIGNDMALCYENGWGVERSLLQAARWYKHHLWDGTQEGDAYVLCSVGEDYRNRALNKGKNCKEWKLALEYLQESAQYNNSKAQFFLGVSYQFGYGVKINIPEAAAWYRKAGEQGHTQACLSLSELYAKVAGEMWNPIEASRWKRKAGVKGNKYY